MILVSFSVNCNKIFTQENDFTSFLKYLINIQSNILSLCNYIPTFEMNHCSIVHSHVGFHHRKNLTNFIHLLPSKELE